MLPPPIAFPVRNAGAASVEVSGQIVMLNRSGEPSTSVTWNDQPARPFSVPCPIASALLPLIASQSNDVACRLTFDSFACSSRLPVGTVVPLLYFKLMPKVAFLPGTNPMSFDVRNQPPPETNVVGSKTTTRAVAVEGR